MVTKVGPSKVAVITRTKNRTLLLERCIKNVMGQSFGDFEMVIINDGGDPRPIENLMKKHEKAMDSRIKLVNNRESVGHGEACNVGIENSDSKYIVMLDDDDTWHPDFLNITVAYLEESGMQGVVTGSEVINEVIKNDKVQELSRERFLPYVKGISLFDILGGNQFPNMSFVYKHSALKAVGRYDKDASPLEDWDFTIRFLKEYDVHFIDEPLAYYHHRRNQSDDLGNSIFISSLHSQRHIYLRNKYLRNDLSKGVLGIGFMANLSQQLTKGRAEDLTFINDLIRQSNKDTHGGINDLKVDTTEIKYDMTTVIRKIDHSLGARTERYLKRVAKKILRRKN